VVDRAPLEVERNVALLVEDLVQVPRPEAVLAMSELTIDPELEPT